MNDTNDEIISETTPSDPARWHKYADLFPWIDGKAREELKADIAKNGILEPITFLDGEILDGRNRYAIARELGIPYPRVEYTGNDPLGFVISKNLARRHLTESQRAMVAARLAKMPRGNPTLNSANLRNSPSQAEAAEMLNVSERAVNTAKAVERDGAPELVQAVQSGAVKVSAAAEVAKLPKDEQAKIVADGKTAEKAKQAREARKAKQAENDAFREANRARLAAENPRIAAIEAAKERNGSSHAAVAKGDRATQERIEALQAEIEELREANASLEAENAALKAEIKTFSEMKVEYEKGGFAEVIAGKDEVIRAQLTRIEAESRDKVSWKRRSDFFRAEAVKRGWSNNEEIEIETAESQA